VEGEHQPEGSEGPYVRKPARAHRAGKGTEQPTTAGMKGGD
jgi:hypothetical protein